jgi:hypothetical protein
MVALGGANGIADSIKRVHFSSSSPWVTVAGPHQEVADSALLTVGDLPPGWVVLADEDDDFEPEEELSDYCKAMQEQASSEGVDASATAEDMGGPEDQRLSSDVAVFASGEDAQRSLDTMREFFTRCSPEYIAQFEEGVRRGAAENGTVPAQLQVQTTMSEVGPPAAGEAGLVYRLEGAITGPGGSAQFAVDLIAFRHGRMAGTLVYTTVGGVRPEEAAQLTQIAAAKLQAANATLEPA